ncbi:PhzF family phenazine biosynthesis protein [Methylocystis sp. JR02]|uniref:PhzF family phenazine biosynthesis protein n=1 Tax=Methylocystis sp. JR02 TaxID=3046284 RepID=UPI0024B8DF12|nr:PhzF family phenazine biosynthesis protein [Methylocystis sp. JR02]MDJ0449891.1 PhzF family phenazine biosynthesis protein [Methylocystis sp. JR02]
MTRSLSYHLLDVFTDRRFAGNPLAVVELDAPLRDAEMQDVAREFNLSETVFLSEPRDPTNSARIRIFTPKRELPFAGHPTIGAAALLAEQRAGELLSRHGIVVALEAQIGVLRCEALRGFGKATYVEVTPPFTPLRYDDAPSAATLATALLLSVEDIGFGAHVPVVYAAGPAFVFVPLRSREVLDRARRTDSFSGALGAAVGAYLYTRETVDTACAINARMFANGVGIDEDPATGAAAAAFAGVALEFERPADGEHQLFIEQGHAMGRPSRITLRMGVENRELTRISIGGQVVRVGQGRLFL